MLLRNIVYLRTGMGDPLLSELTARDLFVEFASSVGEMSEAAVRPQTRAIIWGCERPLMNHRERRDLHRFVMAAASKALRCGVSATVVVSGDDAQQTNWAYVTQLVDGGAAAMGAVDAGRFRVKVVKAAEANGALAQACVRHDPQRHWVKLPVIGERSLPIEERDRVARAFRSSPEDKWLLQRAFNDCTSLEAKLLQTRRSGSEARRVYQVWPHRDGAPPIVPFIVKTASAEAVESELGSAQIVCGDRTPFSYFSPIAYDRNVTGWSRAALVSHFIERAATLEAYIASHSPAVAMASLFDGPLRCWRSHMRTERIAVGHYPFAKGIASKRARDYADVYEKVTAEGRAVVAPGDLLARLRARPQRDVQVCTSHGDLHINNIFVRENSVDVVLIDFNRAGDAPASRDPAELEVSLAFTKPQASANGLTHEEITNLYSSPLLGRASMPRRSHARALAIEQVRKEISGVVPEDEYRDMLIGHLLWHARRGTGAAYEAASRLSQDG